MGEALEWDVQVPLVSNVYVLVDVLLALFFVSTGLAGVVLYAIGFGDVIDVLRLFIVAVAVFIVLLLMVMGFVFSNQFQLLYRLDDDGVLVRVGEFESGINRAAWVVSSIVQRYGFSGGRVFVLVNEELYVPWVRVSRAVFDDRHRVVSLNSDLRVLIRVYCTVENVDRVFSMVRGLVPEPEDQVSLG
jgi:hypothetical protein